jgi:hypothetical protein
MGKSQANESIVELKTWEKIFSGILLTLLNFSLLFSIFKLVVVGLIPGSSTSSFYVLIGLIGAAFIGAIIWAVLEQVNLDQEVDKTKRLFTKNQGRLYLLSPTHQNMALIKHVKKSQFKSMKGFSRVVRVVFNWVMRPFLIMSATMGVVALVRSLMGHPPLTITQLMWTVGASLVLGLIFSGIGWHIDIQKEKSRLSLLKEIKEKQSKRHKEGQPIFSKKKIQKHQEFLRILGAIGIFFVPFIVYIIVQSLIPTYGLSSRPHWASIVCAFLVWGMVELMARGKTVQVLRMVRMLGVLIGISAASYLALRLFLSTFMKISFLNMTQDTGMMAMLCLFAVLCGIVAATMDYVQQCSPTVLIAGNIMALSVCKLERPLATPSSSSHQEQDKQAQEKRPTL